MSSVVLRGGNWCQCHLWNHMAEVGINVTCGISWWKLLSMSPVELRGGNWYQCHLWNHVTEVGINEPPVELPPDAVRSEIHNVDITKK